MSNTLIQLRSSGITGNVPSTLQPGELAINFVDGKLFYGTAISGVVEFSTSNPAGLNGELQFNSSGDLGASSNVRYDTSSGILYVNSIVANTLTNTTLTQIDNKAQGAYDLANTLSGGTSTDGWARDTANSASSYANSAYLQANTATSNASTADQRAVTSGSYANSAYTQANTASVNAISAGSYANGAFAKANTSNIQANSAYAQANLSLVVAQAAYDQANVGGSSVDSLARTTANGAYLHANSAYDLANTLSSGSTILIDDENSSNNVYYINFTDRTSGATSSLNVSSNNLTFKPDTGTLGVKELNVSSNLSIVSNYVEITGNSQTVIDTFSSDLYRSAFYQFQVESGSDFHSFSYNVGQNGDDTKEIMFGDIYSTATLGTISSNVSSGLVNVMFTPTNENSTVLYSRNALVKMNTGLGNDLGFLDLATITFDYGFVEGSATILDLGMLA
jgi:hypothetical protein